LIVSQRIDGTDLIVSRIGFGTGSLHHAFGRRDRHRLLETAAAHGLLHFDTAPYYGYGLAEADLGSFIRHRRARFTIATKIGLYPVGAAARTGLGVWVRKGFGKVMPSTAMPDGDWSVARASESLRASLQRLKTDYVDILLVHEPRLTADAADEMYSWLVTEQTKGSIREFGVAGLEESVGWLVAKKHPLTRIVQTKDSLERKQADFVTRAGRRLQFTYGYLSQQPTRVADPSAIVTGALERNAFGCVIVSSRSPQRVVQLASCG
jgi:D-threo-aldose 1-dehydrogenase